MPAAERAELERFRQYHLARTLTLAGDLAQLAADLAGRSIRFVAFKGPTLSLALYGDLAGREYNDLDLIVPPEQVDVAEDAILSMDYRSPQGDRTFRRMFLSPQRQYAFVRDEAHTAIDLHWAFSGSHVPFPLAAADAWESAIPLTVGNRTVPVLSTPNLALLLAGHGTKEGWTMLKWVSDFARLVDRHPIWTGKSCIGAPGIVAAERPSCWPARWPKPCLRYPFPRHWGTSSRAATGCADGPPRWPPPCGTLPTRRAGSITSPISSCATGGSTGPPPGSS